MRLPTATPKQTQGEDARELHETLYRTFKDPSLGRLFIACPLGTANARLIKLSHALHKFWGKRGFQFKCKVTPDKSGFHVWIQEGAVHRRPKVAA